MSVFGNILVASQLEEAVINTLIKWFPTYLREIERQIGLQKDTLATPMNYTNRNKFDSLVAEQIPKVVVISPGLLQAPKARSNKFTATWRMGVGVATAASDEPTANMLVKAYGAAVRAIMLQQQGLGGTVSGISQISWLDETYDDLPVTNQNKLYKAAGNYFGIDCDNVVTKWAGPDTPDQNSYSYGEVQTIVIDIVKEEISGTVP